MTDRRESSADLLVIGLGAMGSSTVDAAARAGHTVIGLEAFAQGHARGSSHGPTRMLRRSIEEGPQYVPLILDALPRWAELNDDADAARHRPARRDPHRPERIADARRVRHQRGRLGARLRPPQRRRGQPTVPGVLGARGLLGDVRARGRRAVRRPHGARAAGPGHPPRRVAALRRAGRLVGGERRLGRRADGDRDVSRRAARDHRRRLDDACWPPNSGSRSCRTGSSTCRSNPHRHRSGVFEVDRLPAFVVSDGIEGVYGIPAVDGQGVKVGGGGTPVDPDDVDRVVTDDEIAHLRGFVDRFLPGASGPVVVGPHLSLHGRARRPLRHRPPPRTRQRRDRLTVLRARLQVHDGDRPAADRARLHRTDHPADRLVLDRPLRTAPPHTPSEQEPHDQQRDPAVRPRPRSHPEWVHRPAGDRQHDRTRQATQRPPATSATGSPSTTSTLASPARRRPCSSR